MRKILLLSFLFIATKFTTAQSLIENFDNITTLTPNGWVMNNLSNPIGTNNWFQGSAVVFSAFNGNGDSYIGANFNNVAGAGNISNWLISPVLNMQNGDTIRFYTRTQNPSFIADRLQVRLNTTNTGTNVGTTDASVGDFTTLIQDINPTLSATGYPTTWTQYSYVISGLSGITQGRVAFRYFVTNGGPSGSNSDYIGIDNFEFTSSLCSPNSTTINQSICSGASYTFNGQSLTIAGTYYDTLVNTGGCDSFITLNLTVNPAPTVVANSNLGTTVCAGTMMTLTGSGTTSYTWNNGVTDNVAFAAGTTTTYIVTGTDALGCTDTDQITITVNPAPTVVANASPATTVCVGTMVTFTGSGATSYTWDNGITDNVAFAASNTTTYVVTGTDAIGCTDTDQITITVNPAPLVVANVSPSTSVCVGSLVTLTGSGATSYTWDNGVTDNVAFAAGTTTTYVVTGTDAFGCSNTNQITITVNPLPTVVANVSPGTTVCAGTMITLTGSGTTSYTWNNGVTDNVAFAAGTTTTYVVTGTDALGCTDTDQITITVNPAPTVVANASPATTVCTGTMVTLTGSGATSYTWDNGVIDNVAFAASNTTTYVVTGTDAIGCTATANITLTVNQPSSYSYNDTICDGSSITFNGQSLITAGTYYDTLVNTGGCDSFITLNLTVNSLPTVTALATKDTICLGNSVDLMVMPDSNTYIWVGNGIFNATNDTATAVPTIAGNQIYTVTATATGGCTTTAIDSVFVNTAPTSLAMANTTNTQNQADGTVIIYSNNSCELIATVDDGAGGNTLGNTVAIVTIEGTVPTWNTQPYTPRWYDIVPTNQGAATITLYQTQADFDNYNIYASANSWPLMPANPTDTNVNNIRITKVSGGGLGIGTPTVITPTVAWDTTNNYWALTFSVVSFSQFYIHAVNPGNLALAITLSKFNVVKTSNSDIINWTTATEINNNYFTVQRSTDGVHFENIEKVNSKAVNGNSETELNYSFEDTKPLSGYNYYRLLQTDIDGTTTVASTVKYVLWNSNSTVATLYPNPAKTEISIDINAIRNANTTIRLTDVTGKTVKIVEAKTIKGTNTININIAELSSGLYNVLISENGRTISSMKMQKL